MRGEAHVINSFDRLPMYYYNYPGGIPNLGDYVGRYIAERISKKEIRLVDKGSDHPKLISVGSVIDNKLGPNTIVWGAGIKSEHWVPSPAAHYVAVRGPLTLKILKERGIPCPDVLGDPALLLPQIFRKPTISKKYELGIVPHYYDQESIFREMSDAKTRDKPHIIRCDTSDVEKFVREITSCELVVSSSLHGLIISHAYGIPALWLKFSEDKRIASGRPFKYHDYFLSVGIEPYNPSTINPITDYKKIVGFMDKNHKLLSIQKVDLRPLANACPISPGLAQDPNQQQNSHA